MERLMNDRTGEACMVQSSTPCTSVADSTKNDISQIRQELEDLTKKNSRRLGEKLRRDRLNNCIIALSQEIPWIAKADRRLDKSQILCLTVNFLKLHFGLRRKTSGSVKNWYPSYVNIHTVRHALKQLGGDMFLIVSQSGTIVYASKGLSTHLGHAKVDVLGQSFYDLVHSDDHRLFQAQFTVGNVTNLSTGQSEDDADPVLLTNGKREHRSFVLRLKNNLGDKNPSSFSRVSFQGSITEDVDDSKKFTKHSGLNDKWLVACGKILHPENQINNISMLDSSRQEWISQHKLDGTIIFSDQRVAQCLGLLSTETKGSSCYHMIHPEDLQAVGISHMKIMTDGETPSTIFRLCPLGDDIIFIQSRSVIVRDPWTKEPKYISSINIVLGENEGSKLLLDQKKKVEALIALTKGMTLQDKKQTSSNPVEQSESESGYLSSDTGKDFHCTNQSPDSTEGGEITPLGDTVGSSEGKPQQKAPLLKSLLTEDKDICAMEPTAPFHYPGGRWVSKVNPVHVSPLETMEVDMVTGSRQHAVYKDIYHENFTQRGPGHLVRQRSIESDLGQQNLLKRPRLKGFSRSKSDSHYSPLQTNETQTMVFNANNTKRLVSLVETSPRNGGMVYSPNSSHSPSSSCSSSSSSSSSCLNMNSPADRRNLSETMYNSLAMEMPASVSHVSDFNLPSSPGSSCSPCSSSPHIYHDASRNSTPNDHSSFNFASVGGSHNGGNPFLTEKLSCFSQNISSSSISNPDQDIQVRLRSQLRGKHQMLNNTIQQQMQDISFMEQYIKQVTSATKLQLPEDCRAKCSSLLIQLTQLQSDVDSQQKILQQLHDKMHSP